MSTVEEGIDGGSTVPGRVGWNLNDLITHPMSIIKAVTKAGRCRATTLRITAILSTPALTCSAEDLFLLFLKSNDKLSSKVREVEEV